MKVGELSGAQLDYWVAKALGHQPRMGAITDPAFCEIVDWNRLGTKVNSCRFMPSTDWAHGGPIIEREEILLMPMLTTNDWSASTYEMAKYYHGATLLEAAMRCYVASKFGEEVNE